MEGMRPDGELFEQHTSPAFALFSHSSQMVSMFIKAYQHPNLKGYYFLNAVSECRPKECTPIMRALSSSHASTDRPCTFYCRAGILLSPFPNHQGWQSQIAIAVAVRLTLAARDFFCSGRREIGSCAAVTAAAAAEGETSTTSTSTSLLNLLSGMAHQHEHSADRINPLS